MSAERSHDAKKSTFEITEMPGQKIEVLEFFPSSTNIFEHTVVLLGQLSKALLESEKHA